MRTFKLLASAMTLAIALPALADPTGMPIVPMVPSGTFLRRTDIAFLLYHGQSVNKTIDFTDTANTGKTIAFDNSINGTQPVTLGDVTGQTIIFNIPNGAHTSSSP